MTENGFYDDPLVYDILHASGTAREVGGLAKIARKFGTPPYGKGTTWLEPACGTGRYLRAAALRGHTVVGFDLSKDMIEYARSRMPEGAEAELFVADMSHFAARVKAPVDFAFCLINTIRHIETDEAMARHLSQVRRVLRPGGVYAVGLSTSAYGLESPAEDVWEGRRGGLHVKQIVEYVPPTKARDRFEKAYNHLVITRGGREEHRDSSYALRCYSGAQWKKVVRMAGMEIIATVGPDAEPHEPDAFGYSIYVLRAATRRRRSG